ncbi:hypothetical protein ACWEPZ_37790 [Streptomyces sp. NPDC004288]|uniref:hypothetical protein n=1 Tax=Streptomyces sp. NPDC005574 TaxID=3156891 RepID=UPI0033A4048B
MFGLTTTRRLRTELAAAYAETSRQRRRAETAEEDRDVAIFNRRQVLGTNASLDADNRRLTGRNLELGRRISLLTESDPEHAGRLDVRVTRLLKVAARILRAYEEEKARADRLQRRLDDSMGLNTSRVRDGRHWQHTRDDKRTPRTKEAQL